MNAKTTEALKSILIYSAKQAVNAILINVVPYFQTPGTYNFHNWAGVEHILVLAGGAVLSREFLVWGPKILKWSQE
jgi:hypothetical protein